MQHHYPRNLSKEICDPHRPVARSFKLPHFKAEIFVKYDPTILLNTILAFNFIFITNVQYLCTHRHESMRINYAAIDTHMQHKIIGNVNHNC